MPDAHTINRLRSQLSRGEVVLFTGAGFSRDARNRLGNHVPSTAELRQIVWDVCFPGEDPDKESTLGELYELALEHHREGLVRTLEQQLSVDAENLPEYYRLYFAYPWYRVYTLNIDDIELAAQRRFPFDRRIARIPATGTRQGPRSRTQLHAEMEVIHLNGMIPDHLDALTFSELQYAKRISRSDPWYTQCVSDLTARPTIFIGTMLNEVPLWQHVELRRREVPGIRDLRPTSVLITPELSVSRQALLSTLKIEWLPGTAESFASDYLSKVTSEANRGFVYLKQQAHLQGTTSIPLVSELAAERPTLQTEYLLGSDTSVRLEVEQNQLFALIHRIC